MKTFYVYKMRIFIFIFLIGVITLGAGAMAAHLLSGDSFFNVVYVGILDLDDSTETRMIISAISGAEEYEGLVEFILLERNLFSYNINDKENFQISQLYYESISNLNLPQAVSAIIIFPENFGTSMITGENMPFTVLYNENAPIAASVINIATEAFTNMLRTSQMGIYTAINYSRYAQRNQNEIFLGVNMNFLGFILNRGELFETEVYSISGRVGVWFSYLASAYIALMICGFFIFTDITRNKFTQFTIKRLKAMGFSASNIYLSTLASYFLLFIFINTPLSLANLILYFFTNLEVPIIFALPQIVIILIVLSAFGASVSFIFKNELSAGLFVSIFAVVSLFLSGGIIPLNLMDTTFSKLSFNYWGVQLLEASFLNENILMYSLMLTIFTIIFSIMGIARLKRI